MTRLAALAVATGLIVTTGGLSGCLAEGTRSDVDVTALAPGSSSSPSADASDGSGTSGDGPVLPSGDRDPVVLGSAGSGLAGVRAATSQAGSGTVLATANPDALLRLAGGPQRLVALPGTPRDVVVPDSSARRAVVLWRSVGQPARTGVVTWGATGTRARLTDVVDAPDAVGLTVGGAPVAVDAGDLVADGAEVPATPPSDVTDRVWSVVADGGSLRLGVASLPEGAPTGPLTLTPVTAWADDARPTALLVTASHVWVGTSAGRVWRLDVDGARAGNPVAYELARSSVDALTSLGDDVLLLTSGRRTVRVDAGTGDPVDGA